MDTERLHELLAGVKSGGISIVDAMDQLANLPYEELGFAKLDHHRALRRGFP